jgi:tetratricopeptide (TPR) repeat protein
VYYYVNEVYKLAPQYIGVYGYDLGMVCAQTRSFSKALEVADAMYNNDIEDGSSYGIRSVVERLQGNYPKAIEWADKGLEKNAGNGDLLRYKAMAQICNGDLKGAKEIIDGIIASGGTDYLYLSISLVIETELGNTENVDALKERLETDEIEIPERVQDYLDGELTAKELFTEGSGDVA